MSTGHIDLFYTKWRDFSMKKYGKYVVKTITESNIYSSSNGTLTYTVTQPYTDYPDLKSGKAKFSARVYGEATCTYTISSVQQGGHSGGSGR